VSGQRRHLSAGGELPGFEREDIGIDLDGTTLVYQRARHSSESGEKDKDGNYLRRERKFGSFSRSFDVSGVDTEHISAAYKNGVLELTLPKQAARVPQARRIEIAGV
jgi:HSP20 family protein